MIYCNQITNSFKETKKLGFWLAQQIANRTQKTIILLQGTVGSGKTTFTKGLIQSLGINQIIASPTFVLMKTYETTNRKVYHLDLYKSPLEEEFLEELLEEFINPDILIVEFPQDHRYLFPNFNFLIKIDFINEKQRRITMEQNI
ncbi:tRNA (adenosine(37)-N6)-threonylcarbamoyltransferase complex ATPase subunit type 1 TsaE [Candidatus Phytoplasma meliae]|uniref:tRNA threonylcarbamoyladenosine biosynthesis protein TsaE n=1 Tax=Candidatus Phytoplasma meliae TaxID=1848402 RepID=A0ABS5CXJ8_9MOLU|nr:tRNA (adenosine(37)-N6)-threonylcarbamoyltransferase complex ATPase subunit type 1 TsaE [Candidatus Phytoplasma meliae]MBP5835700.1 tRNA (adenosine(37)-N6)-threonylcarbamoyltransferase complex ATPase subunit type 1 TsaE [Candidatus Phytoplasma meliae]